jgi:hypothetical protein
MHLNVTLNTEADAQRVLALVHELGGTAAPVEDHEPTVGQMDYGHLYDNHPRVLEALEKASAEMKTGRRYSVEEALAIFNVNAL